MSRRKIVGSLSEDALAPLTIRGGSLPLFMTPKSNFYSFSRFQEPSFENLFDTDENSDSNTNSNANSANNASSSNEDAKLTTPSQNQLVDFNSAGSRCDTASKVQVEVFNDISQVSSELDIGLAIDEKNHGKLDVNLDINKLTLFISIKKQGSHFYRKKPNGIREASYYLSEVTYGSSCVIKLVLTGKNFSTNSDVKILMENVAQGMSIESDNKILKTIQNLTAEIISNFDSKGIDVLVASINSSNCASELPKLYKAVSRKVSANSMSTPIQGIYRPHYTNPNASSLTYLMTILSHIEKYRKYYGYNHTAGLDNNLITSVALNLLQLNSNPAGVNASQISKTVLNSQINFDAICSEMDAIDKADYVMNGDFLKINFVKDKNIANTDYVTNVSNIILGNIVTKSNSSDWLSKLGYFWQAIPDLIFPDKFFSENGKKMGLLAAAIRKPHRVWFQIRKHNDSPASHVVELRKFITLACVDLPDEKHTSYKAEYILDSTSLQEVTAPAEALGEGTSSESPSIEDTSSEDSFLKINHPFVVNIATPNKNNFLLSQDTSKGYGPPNSDRSNCAQFFFHRHSHNQENDKPKLNQLKHALNNIF